MGVTFRSGGYIRFVRLGGRTIKDGEAAAIWNRQGVHTQVVGPKRVQLWFSTIRFLTRFKAESHQYLVVKHKDGRTEHIRGPATLFANPAYHDDVYVKDAVLLKSDSEFIVVYVHNHDKHGSKLCPLEKAISSDKTISSDETSSKYGHQSDDDTRRVIIQGPTLFVPKPNEEVHEFSWSKFNPNGRSLVEDRDKLCVAEYRNGFSVSKEKNEFCVFRALSYPMTPSSSLKLTFELPSTHSIHAELDVQFRFQFGSSDTTAVVLKNKSIIDSLLKFDDPVLKMYKAMQADAVSIGATISVDDIRSDKCVEMIDDLIGNKGSYEELNKVAKECNMEITSLRLVSWKLNDDLVDLIRQERSIRSKVESEITEKEQRRKIILLEQENNCKAVEDEVELKRMQLTSDDQLDKEMHRMKLLSLERSLELQMVQIKASHDQERMKNKQALSLLTEMKDLGVDLTQFLTAASNQHIANEPLSSLMMVKGDLLKNVKDAT